MATQHYPKHSIAGQVVLITGASSGFGEAIAWRCAEIGCKLILLARREEKLNALKAHVTEVYPGVAVHVVPMDVRKLVSVAALPEVLPAEFKEVDILINNAGLALGAHAVHENLIEDVQTMLETNVLAVAAFMRAFTPGMVARNRGHIVNVGSVAGWEPYKGVSIVGSASYSAAGGYTWDFQGSAYCASKHALRAFTSAARDDLAATDIRLSMISPGAVETEFSLVRFKGDEQQAAKVYTDYAKMVAADIADNVVYIITRPPHVQINDLIVSSVHQSGAKPPTRPYAVK